MNKQGPNGIEWTDATWNPIGGCKHACRWKMPDGNIAICYAETTAEHGVASTAYPMGFAHHYWRPHKLQEPINQKTPMKVFLDSMSDLMGHWVPDTEINQVLETCHKAHWHSFQLLTKNPKRLLDFDFPDNVWVGVSTPPDFMMGKELSQDQKHRMLRITLDTLSQIKTPVRWISAEPLSWDITPLLSEYASAINWCVIGAASNGKTLYAPNESYVKALVEHLEANGVTVFYKGNMRTLEWAVQNWRNGFPVAVTHGE